MSTELDQVQEAVGSEFDEKLFDMCRTGDYVGIYLEIDRRLNSGWLPIESAPKDGSPFIGYRKFGVTTYGDGSCVDDIWVRDCRWQDGKFRASDIAIGPPTHWMPLPHPPA